MGKEMQERKQAVGVEWRRIEIQRERETHTDKNKNRRRRKKR